MTLHRFLTLINLFLIALIVYFGVSLFYRMAVAQPQSSGEMHLLDIAPISNNQTVDHSADFYRPIVDRDLFHAKHAVSPLSAIAAQPLDNLAETQLNLKLWGTVSGDMLQGYAVIEDTQKREQNLYQVGDDVQQATIKMILRGKVVLTVSGQDEVLSMEDPASSPPGGMVSRAPVSRGGPVTPPTEMQDESILDTQRVSLSRSMIDEAMQDVTKLMTEIAVTPHMEEDQAAGLALSNIKPSSIFRRMGLRNGDILMAVDGQEIRTVDDALSFYQNLRSSSDLKVQINRRGQERTIEYNIR